MKKNSSMITLILALFGCALIMGSVFSLYRSSNAVEYNNVNDTEIDIANKKIDVLTNEIQETKEQIVDNDQSPTAIIKEDSHQFTNQNIPIVEIKDLDLGEGNDLGEPTKKGKRVMYNHQIKISIMNVGKYSLKDVIFSIKDIYNESVDKKSKKAPSQYNYMGRTFDNEDLGAYNNIEVNTLNLKTKKLIYVSNLPSSFGVGDYYFDIIVEWNNGFYQMHVDIEESNGKLKYRYQFYDVDGNPIDFKKIQESINV